MAFLKNRQTREIQNIACQKLTFPKYESFTANLHGCCSWCSPYGLYFYISNFI